MSTVSILFCFMALSLGMPLLCLYTPFLMMMLLIDLDWVNLESFMSKSSIHTNQMELLLTVLCISSSFTALMVVSTEFFQGSKPNFLITLQIALLLIMVICFKVKSLILFYIMFETSLIPIFIIIMGWGYQPERLSAGISMMMYLLFSSLPMMYFFLFMCNNSILNFFDIYTNGAGSSSNMMVAMMSLGFMAKLPIYGLHLWLPRAHVEAPAGGSMVLAAVLLKLGGYGMVMLSPMIPYLNLLCTSYLCLSILGSVAAAFLVCKQTDLKTLIAYSSVSHMNLMISSILSFKQWGLISAVGVMFSHGLVSSGLFLLANSLYSGSNSRSVLVNRSTLEMAPFMGLTMMGMCLGNMGVPPTLNFSSEFMCVFISLTSLSQVLMLSISFILFFATVFTMILYMSTQNMKSKFNSMTSPMGLTESSNIWIHLLSVMAGPLIVTILIFS